MNMWDKIKNKLFALMGIILVVLGILCIDTCNKLKVSNSLYDSLNDTLIKTVNSLGQETTKTAIIMSDYNSFKNLNAGKDSMLLRLQSIVDRNTISATLLKNKTTDKGTTTTEIRYDTLMLGKDSILVYPVYYTVWEDKWSKGSIKATKDSIVRDIVSFNEFSLEQRWEKPKGIKNIFKPKEAVTTVLNNNPYTETTDLKTFTVKCECNRRGYFLGGLGAGFLGGFLTSNQINKK